MMMVMMIRSGLCSTPGPAHTHNTDSYDDDDDDDYDDDKVWAV